MAHTDMSCDHCGVVPETLVECTSCALRVCPECPCECDDEDDASDDQAADEDEDEDAA